MLKVSPYGGVAKPTDPKRQYQMDRMVSNQGFSPAREKKAPTPEESNRERWEKTMRMARETYFDFWKVEYEVTDPPPVDPAKFTHPEDLDRPNVPITPEGLFDLMCSKTQTVFERQYNEWYVPEAQSVMQMIEYVANGGVIAERIEKARKRRRDAMEAERKRDEKEDEEEGEEDEYEDANDSGGEEEEEEEADEEEDPENVEKEEDIENPEGWHWDWYLKGYVPENKTWQEKADIVRFARRLNKFLEYQKWRKTRIPYPQYNINIQALGEKEQFYIPFVYRNTGDFHELVVEYDVLQQIFGDLLITNEQARTEKLENGSVYHISLMLDHHLEQHEGYDKYELAERLERIKEKYSQPHYVYIPKMWVGSGGSFNFYVPNLEYWQTYEPSQDLIELNAFIEDAYGKEKPGVTAHISFD